MKRNLWHLALVFVAASSLSGCKGMWNDLFGGSSSQQAATLAPGDLEQCNPVRDPNIATWLTTNQPCSSTAQCHMGSFCTGSGSAGVCIRECGDGLPNCSGNRYCSCQGLCEAISATPSGDASAPSPSCDKVTSRLEEIKNSNDQTKWVRCESDDICPNGAFCNQSIGYCDWECLDDLSCDTGMTCNCLGRCENPDAGATVVRRKFAMDVSPAVVQVTPAVIPDAGTTVNTWVRSMNIVLSTRDENLLGGTGDTRSFLATVTVRPGASLKVACNASGTPDYQIKGCDLGAVDGDSWQFSLVGDAWTATKTVWLTPSGAAASGDAGTGGDDWTIRIHSDATAPGTKVVPVEVGAAKSASNWTAPVWSDFGFTGSGDAPKGFRGTVLLRTPLGFAGESLPGVDHEIQVPVRASVRPESGDVFYVTFADPTTLFLQGSTLTLASDNAFPSQGPWLGLQKAGWQAAQGRWDIAYELKELKRNQRTGTLVGKFEGTTVTASVLFQQIVGSFTLEVDSSFVPCTDDSSCTGGATCGEGGLCVNAVPAVSDALGLTLEHQTRNPEKGRGDLFGARVCKARTLPAESLSGEDRSYPRP